jgi:transcriptional regulator with XRE-family HTH domain
MEFNEKLQELRKSKSLTQEELAKALFVSRTAISKWEQGRGYPGIDSLKEISRFFSVSIDDLICSEEIISAAADEKKECVEKYISLICNTLDIFLALLLFLPVFGNGTDHPVSVSLYAITGLSTWIKTVFAALISLAALNGICGVIINHFDKPVWNRHRLMTGMMLSVACAAVFILTRQPYAGIICLAVLVVKGFMVARGKGLL